MNLPSFQPLLLACENLSVGAFAIAASPTETHILTTSDTDFVQVIECLQRKLVAMSAAEARSGQPTEDLIAIIEALGEATHIHPLPNLDSFNLSSRSWAVARHMEVFGNIPDMEHLVVLIPTQCNVSWAIKRHAASEQVLENFSANYSANQWLSRTESSFPGYCDCSICRSYSESLKYMLEPHKFRSAPPSICLEF